MPLRMIEWVWPPQTSISAQRPRGGGVDPGEQPTGQRRVPELVEVPHGIVSPVPGPPSGTPSSENRRSVSRADSSSRRVMAKPAWTIV